MNHGKGLRTVFFLVLRQLLGYFVQSHIPRDSLPFPASPLTNSPHGIFEAVGVIGHLRLCTTLDTGKPPVHRVVRVSLDLDDFSVKNMNKHTAFTMTCLANASDDSLFLVHISTLHEINVGRFRNPMQAFGRSRIQVLDRAIAYLPDAFPF